MLTGHKSLTGSKCLIGSRIAGFSGIGLSGLVIPAGAQLYYAFNQTDLSKAITDQVNSVDVMTTARADVINILRSSNNQVETFAAGVAAFDRGQNLQVWNEATNIAIHSQSLLDVIWIKSGVSVINNGGSVSGMPSQTCTSSGSSANAVNQFCNDTIPVENNTYTVSAFVRSKSGAQKIRLKCSQAGVLDYFSPDIDISEVDSRCTFTQSFGAGGDNRVIAGIAGATDNSIFDIEVTQIDVVRLSSPQPSILTGASTEVRDATRGQVSTTNLTTSSFKAGGEVDQLSLSTGSATLWVSGDSSLIYDQAAAQIQAKTGANTAVLAVPDISAINSAYFSYDGVNIYCIVDDVAGVGVASSEPVLGASFDLMQDGVGGGYFDSPKLKTFYGGAI